jgi:hypothetical protein
MIKAETVSEMLHWNSTFLRLIAQKDYIAFSRCENFKSYKWKHDRIFVYRILYVYHTTYDGQL